MAAIETLMLSGVADGLTYALRNVLFATALFILAWQLPLVALVVALLFWLITRHFSREIKAASREKLLVDIYSPTLHSEGLTSAVSDLLSAAAAEKTVKGHLTSIFHRIGVSDRVQAALWAHTHEIAWCLRRRPYPRCEDDRQPARYRRTRRLRTARARLLRPGSG